MKHLAISCQKHKIGSLLLSSRCMTNYMKTCSFLHAHFAETNKVVDNLFEKSLWCKKNSFISNRVLWVHIGIAYMKQFQCVPSAYATENKDNYLEIYTYQVPCPLSQSLLNIQNCQSVLKYLLFYCKLLTFCTTAISRYWSLQITSLLTW